MAYDIDATVIPVRLSTGYRQRLLDAVREPVANDTGVLYAVDELGPPPSLDYTQTVLGGNYRRVAMQTVADRFVGIPWGPWDHVVVVLNDHEQVVTITVSEGQATVAVKNDNGTAAAVVPIGPGAVPVPLPAP